MAKFSTLISALIGLLFASLAWGQGLPTVKPEEVGLSSERLARATQVLKAEVARGQYPGAVALVARKGKIAYFESVGQRDPQAGAPMPKDAIFRLYSMTKPFTSVAAMMLVEEGRLLLSDPVSKFLPQLTNLQVSVPRFDPDTGKAVYALVPAERQMTIQDLLRHTSGLVYAGFTNHAQVKELYTKAGVDWRNVTAAEQIERLAKVPLAHHPGSAWEYSLSTDVLGRVVEVVSGTTLGVFLSERIFVPLKMTDTAFLVPKDKVGRLAQPFATDKATGKPIELLDVTVPQKNDAGGAGTAGTTGDYARFGQMLLNGGRLDGVRLLSRTTVSHMASDHLGTIRIAGNLDRAYTFGLGFAVRKDTGLASAAASAGEYRWGGAAGTAFLIDPKEQMVVVFMTQNQPGAPRRYDRELFQQVVYQAIVD
jgi:CubicO group peptidase (beta-lactamase class C family)